MFTHSFPLITLVSAWRLWVRWHGAGNTGRNSADKDFLGLQLVRHNACMCPSAEVRSPRLTSSVYVTAHRTSGCVSLM